MQKNSQRTLAKWMLVVGALLPGTMARAQDFGTRGWVGTTPAWQSQTAVNHGYAAQGRWPAPQQASYWVERDPRYRVVTGVTPATYAPLRYAAPGPRSTYRPYADTYPTLPPTPTAYPSGGACGMGYGPPRPPVPRSYYPSSNLPHSVRMPNGYYRADGIFGKDTVFADGQPVRNLFRYLLP